MKNIIAIIIVLAGLSCLASYKIGRSRGFDKGWDMGFQRGIENPEYQEVK